MQQQAKTEAVTALDIERIVKDVLATIDREREREIIARRFGLFDRKETLEQIGELLGITRERVRQLEKAVMVRLRAAAAKNELPHITEVEKSYVHYISQFGGVARINELTAKLSSDDSKLAQARVSFLAELCPGLSIIEDNDHFHHAVGIKSMHDEKVMRERIQNIIEAIKDYGKPIEVTGLSSVLKHDAKHLEALAGVSKQLASLNGHWGLSKWPLVNPKNIRDKIYVILRDQGKPMHFNEIAEAIKTSNFRRKDVTTQAIHNELIKDKRFVLVGRGLYALKEWGFKKGTVADMIEEVLRKEDGPLHRDEIVKRVLKHRFVKETTILLNLQGKSQFQRVAKATYKLLDIESIE